MHIGFHVVEPEIAKATIRSVLVEAGGSVPAGEYGFLELYCPKADCDCRRVSLMVVNQQYRESCATIRHIFDGGDLASVDEVTYLDPSQPAAPFAAGLLQIVKEMLHKDKAFVRRLHEHYAMVRRAVADPKHPCQARIAKLASAPRRPKGTQLPPGSIGTERSPVCVSVRNNDQLIEVARMADELNVHYIARIAADQPVDMRDFSRIGQMAPVMPQNLSRHERRQLEKVKMRKR